MTLIFASFALIMLLNLTALATGAWWGRKVYDLEYNPSGLTLGYGLGIVSTLLLLLNLNQVFAAKYIFLLLLVSSPLLIVWCLQTSSPVIRKKVISDFAELSVVTLLGVISVSMLFGVTDYWVTEGPNHDSIIYFEGLNWAIDYPTQASKELVDSVWQLGSCGDGGSLYIGRDCLLYRGGTYTLLAWAQSLAPETYPNGIWIGATTCLLLVWYAVKLVANYTNIKNHALVILLTAFCAVNTGYLSTLTNSNLATTFGAASIGLTFALIFLPVSKAKPVLIGASVALVGHLYAEGIFYAGLFAAFTLLGDATVLNQGLKDRLLAFAKATTLALACFLVLGNFPIFLAFKSLLLFTDLVQSGQHWPAWYLHQSEWQWIASFVSGELVGHAEMSSLNLTIAGLLLVCIALITNVTHRTAMVALLSTSLALVMLIEIRHYEYGEHKILQLLGPSWQIFLTLALSTLLVHSKISKKTWVRFLTGFGILGLFTTNLYLQESVIEKSKHLIKSYHDQHRLHSNAASFTNMLRSGDTVLLDDSAFVIGVETYFKSHYAILLAKMANTNVTMPNISEQPLRGGYFRNKVNNSFSSLSEPPLYVLQGKGSHTKRSVFHYEESPISSSQDFDLVDISQTGAMAKGAGWYSCEPVRCWTKSNFELHVRAHSDTTLAIQIGYFYPPKNSSIDVSINGGKTIQFPTNSDYIKINLEKGSNFLVFTPSNWAATSPLERGMSMDSRELFAQVIAVSLKSRSGPK